MPYGSVVNKGLYHMKKASGAVSGGLWLIFTYYLGVYSAGTSITMSDVGKLAHGWM